MTTSRDDEHTCEWRTEALELRDKLAEMSEKLEALQKKVFGKSTEKMPPMDREVRRGKGRDPAAQAEARRKNAEIRDARIRSEQVSVPVPPEDQKCPACADGGQFSEFGPGKKSSVYEYVEGYFRRRHFTRQVMSCRCGRHMATAPVPDKVFGRTQYGPRFIAWIIVSKCCDAIPIYRLEKIFARMGIPMARSTMTALFNRAGEMLLVLAHAILERVAQAPLVMADETPQRLQNGTKGFMWTFIGGDLVAYQFSLTRSGDTPKRVLEGTEGTLLVDMYTGYNAVTGTGKRERAGCLAHVRRKFFEALATTPEAQTALDLIREIYVIESQVKAMQLAGTDAHAKVRMQETLPHLDRLYIWLAENKDRYRPKSKMSRAIGYALKNWQALTRFILNPTIPPDNNRSEGALRVVAMLRKASLFAHDPDTADNLAALLTVVASCATHELNPVDYLSDVLMRAASTPKEDIATLIPGNWTPLD